MAEGDGVLPPLTEAELESEVGREVTRIRREHRPQLADNRRRCRVCSDPDATRRVNSMLAYGMRPGDIVANIADINDRRPKNAQIEHWSIRRHRENHFNLQEPTREAYLRILERREQEEADIMARGVGSILTARGYLEIVASKGFQELLKDDTTVGFTTGLDAQLKLEELVRADRDQDRLTAIRHDVGLIQQAIRDTFTPEEMRKLNHRLDVLRGVSSEDDQDRDVIEGVVMDDEEDYSAAEPADFTDSTDDDDPLEE